MYVCTFYAMEKKFIGYTHTYKHTNMYVCVHEDLFVCMYVHFVHYGKEVCWKLC